MGSCIPTAEPQHGAGGDGSGCIAIPRPQGRGTFWEAPLTSGEGSLHHGAAEGLVALPGVVPWGDGDRDGVAMRGNSSGFGSRGADVVCGKGPASDILQPAPTSPSLPRAWIRPRFQPL